MGILIGNTESFDR